MRKLLTALAFIVAILIGLDVGAAIWVQGRLVKAGEHATGATSGSAQLGNFPVLYRTLATGTVPKVDMTFRDVPVGRARVDAVNVVLENVTISRRVLVEKQRIQLGHIQVGWARATLTASQVSTLAGRPVQLLADGRVAVSVAGHTVQARPFVAGGNTIGLELGNGSNVSVPLPHTSLLPRVTGLQVTAGRLRVTCMLRDIPPSFSRAVLAA